MSYGTASGGAGMKVEHILGRAWEVLEADVKKGAGGAFASTMDTTSAASPAAEFDDVDRAMETTKVKVSDEDREDGVHLHSSQGQAGTRPGTHRKGHAGLQGSRFRWNRFAQLQ